MASGADARIGIAVETTFGTRVAPAKFVPGITGEALGFDRARYFSNALSTGRWSRPSVLTTRSGSGSLSGEVPTIGFGYLLQGLHGNTVTPVQQAATTAYLQTHTLDTPPDKSFSIQVQTPPVSSSTLIAQDLLGVMFSGITFSWDPGSVLTFSMPTTVKDLDLAQALATYTAPASWSLLSFKGGSISIGGASQTDVIGGGNLEVGFGLRTDAFPLGSDGTMAKPVETAKPTASGSFTADFESLTHYNRVVNDTSADVVLRFEGETIASTYKYFAEVTIPDCKFTSPRPAVGGPGPVQQEVSFSNASTTGDPVVIKYQSTDTTV